MDNIIKRYSNGELTVVWKPSQCIHSGICIRGLNDVFDTKKRPWINITAASTERIVEQVKSCPSGALSFLMDAEGDKAQSSTRVEVLPNGPLLVHGALTVKDKNGNETGRENVTAFCRCGASKSKPYCDGSHTAANFSD